MISSRCPFEVGAKEARRGLRLSCSNHLKCVVREQVERIRGDSSDCLESRTGYKGQATGMCMFDKG